MGVSLRTFGPGANTLSSVPMRQVTNGRSTQSSQKTIWPWLSPLPELPWRGESNENLKPCLQPVLTTFFGCEQFFTFHLFWRIWQQFQTRLLDVRVSLWLNCFFPPLRET